MRAEKIKAKLRSDDRRAAQALKRQERELNAAGHPGDVSVVSPLGYDRFEDPEVWLRSNFWTND